MRQQIISISAATALSLLVSACAHKQSQKGPDQTDISGLQTTEGVQISTGPCMFYTETHSAVAVAIGTAAISASLDWIGGALETAATAKDDKQYGTRNVVVTDGKLGDCVQVVRGRFYFGFDKMPNIPLSDKDRAEKVGPYQQTTTGFIPTEEHFYAALLAAKAANKDTELTAKKVDSLWQRKIWIVDEPDFLMEAILVQATTDKGDILAVNNSGIFVYKPVFAKLNKPASSHWARTDARTMNVYLGFAAAGAELKKPTEASLGIYLGELKTRRSRWYPVREFEWIAPKNATEEERSAAQVVRTEFKEMRSPYESNPFTFSLERKQSLVTVSALQVEHRDASEGLAFVASVFKGSKATIGTEIGKRYIPDLKAAAEEAETTKNEAALNNWEKAFAALFDLATDCGKKAAESPVTVASKIRAATRTYNQTTRALIASDVNITDRPAEVSESKMPHNGDATAVAAACKTISAELTNNGKLAYK